MIFETKEHRDNEETAAWLISNITGYHIAQTATTVPIDWIIAKDHKVYAVGELKVRTQLYDPIKVDVIKIDKLIKWAKALHVKPLFFIAIKQKENPMTLRVLDPTELAKTWGKGRMTLNNPREANDIGDVVYNIPVIDFKVIL